MIKYGDIRKELYKYNIGTYSNLINKYSPYTYIKSVYYMETAALFLYITQGIIKNPNFITMLYLLCGVSGAFLLNLGNSSIQLIGIFLVFTKGTFDWADGPLARRLGKTSFVGHSLDVYGALVSDVAFRLAFVYYSLLQNPEFMYLFPIFAFLLSVTNFKTHTDSQYRKYNSDKIKNQKINDNLDIELKSILFKIYFAFSSVLDARARSIDSLLVLIIVDILYKFNLNYVFLLISFFIVFQAFVFHLGSFYLVKKIYMKENDG